MAYIDATTNRVMWRGVFILDPVTLEPISQTYPLWIQVAPPTGLSSGAQTVAVAGTPVQLSTTSVSILCVKVKALAGNTGDVYVGGATPVFPLAAGEEVSIDINDLSKVYIDADVAGEGVSFIYVVP